MSEGSSEQTIKTHKTEEQPNVNVSTSHPNQNATLGSNTSTKQERNNTNTAISNKQVNPKIQTQESVQINPENVPKQEAFHTQPEQETTSVKPLQSSTTEQTSDPPSTVDQDMDDDFVDDDREANEEEGKKKKKKGTKNEKIESAEERIQKDVWDAEAWTILLGEVQNLNIEQARPYYDRFFRSYPTAGRYWKQYAEHEMGAGNFDRVEQIFVQCLMMCLNVELWRCYLSYVRKVKDPVANRKDIEEAYEFAIKHVGLDIASTPIWTDYIQFLKDAKAQSQYDQSQKMTRIRKVYQKAIMNPMYNLDAVWKDYENFENEVSQALAKGLLAELSPKYKAAWNKVKEMKTQREGLLPNMLATPPRGTIKEQQQKFIWKQLIEFEKKNTQRLPSPEIRERVTFMYKQALLCFYHHAEFWYDAAMYQIQVGNLDDAAEFFENGIKALPDNPLLYFTYADFEESRKNVPKAKQIYEKLLEHRQDSIVYIQYQKFVRRTEGIDQARQIFIRARKSKDATYHIYVASALMEYSTNNNEKVARRVFELGLKQYINEPAYVLEYLKLLEQLNDKNNMRVLFERVLAALPQDKSLEIWNKFVEFEYQHGDKESIAKVVQRREEVFPDLVIGDFRNLINQYTFMDLYPCSLPELEFIDSAIHSIKKGSELLQPKVIKQKYVLPDTSQMLKINPHQLSNNPQQAIYPGQQDFIPEAVAKVLQQVPPITGDRPLPDIEYVMDTLRNNPLPPPPQPTQMTGSKRGREDSDEEDDEDKEVLMHPPPNDIYRRRRQQKLQKIR